MLKKVQTEQSDIIDVKGLENRFGEQIVHKGLEFSVKTGEIIAIIGPSGCGKTTLLRTILMLQKPTAGEVKVFDRDIAQCNEVQALEIQRRWGVMFQSGALFSSLDVIENIMFPLHEYTLLKPAVQRDIALLKIVLAGLDIEVADKYPSELSGGMRKRVALARAIVMDPELLFLDEPTAGLDPKGAESMDDLILELRESLGLTFVMVTHDLDTLWRVPDRIIFLGEGKVLAALPMKELVKQPHPLIQKYFSGVRNEGHVALAEGE